MYEKNRKFVDTDEAAKILGVTSRAIQKWFASGKLEGEFKISNKGGGKSGQKLFVYINDTNPSEKPSDAPNPAPTPPKWQPTLGTTKVHRGEPGSNIQTPLKDGYPVYLTADGRPKTADQRPMTDAGQSIQPLTSTTIQNPEKAGMGGANPPPVGQSQQRRSIPARCIQIGNLRFALVEAFKGEIAKNHRPRAEIVENFLSLYNAGLLLPEIFGEIGEISRSTLYNWVPAAAPEDLIPQYGGAGISKITDHEKNLLLTLLLHQNRLKTAYAITLTKEYLAKKEIESPSSTSTLRRFADQFKKEHFDLWTLNREGEKALNDKVLPYAERDWRLLEVGDGLVADGHRLNFQVIHPVTKKHCRAALVLFWDWKSSYPLGWEIMFEENVQCITSALRNAIICLGKTPKWVLLDNGKAFKAKIFTKEINFEDSELPGMFARLNINYHFAQPYNAQAKPIERIFGILNEHLERLIPSYTGASINDKPAWTKRNEKYARSLHNPYVPTIEDTNGLICAWRDRYAERPSRGRDGLRPIDIYNDGKGPGVDPAELIYLMMDREIKQVHRNGITWLGWHWYDEALYGLKDKVVIRYSLCDLSQIYIFHKNEFLCTAKPVETVHPMASESENPKDMEAVKNICSLKNRVRRGTKNLIGLIESNKQIDWEDATKRSPEASQIVQAVKRKQNSKKFVSLSSPEEIDRFEIQPEEEEPLQFEIFSERYDFLLRKPILTEFESKWIHEYRTGEIAPGEWDLLYAEKEGENASQIHLYEEREKICISG